MASNRGINTRGRRELVLTKFYRAKKSAADLIRVCGQSRLSLSLIIDAYTLQSAWVVSQAHCLIKRRRVAVSHDLGVFWVYA